MKRKKKTFKWDLSPGLSVTAVKSSTTCADPLPIRTLAAHQLDRFLLAHSGSVVGVHEAVQVGAAGPADGGRLPNDGAADGHGVNLKKSGHVELAQTFMVLRDYAEARLCRIA